MLRTAESITLRITQKTALRTTQRTAPRTTQGTAERTTLRTAQNLSAPPCENEMRAGALSRLLTWTDPGYQGDESWRSETRVELFCRSWRDSSAPGPVPGSIQCSGCTWRSEAGSLLPVFHSWLSTWNDSKSGWKISDTSLRIVANVLEMVWKINRFWTPWTDEVSELPGYRSAETD